jgi:hypothetical protein
LTVLFLFNAIARRLMYRCLSYVEALQRRTDKKEQV